MLRSKPSGWSLHKLISCTAILLLFSMITPQESYVDSTKVKDPGLAWKLGFIPGAGQIYNGKYLKAGIFITLQGISLYRFSDFKNRGMIAKRNTYGWWVFGLYVLGILDSYVDAQLSTFPVKIEPDESSDSLEQPGPEPLPPVEDDR